MKNNNIIDVYKLILVNDFKSIEEAHKFCNTLINTSLTELVLLALRNYRFHDISAKNIPQFSNFIDGTYRATQLVNNLYEMDLNYLTVGKMLLPVGKKSVAYNKYGENHLKLAKELGFISISDNYKIVPTKLGEAALQFDQFEFDALSTRLIVRIPVITELLRELVRKPVVTFEYLNNFLSETTAKRRATNVRFLVKKIANTIESDEIKVAILDNLG